MSLSTLEPLRNVPLALPQSLSTQVPEAGTISACLRERYRSLIGMVQSEARPMLTGAWVSGCRDAGTKGDRTVTSAFCFLVKVSIIEPAGRLSGRRIARRPWG